MQECARVSGNDGECAYVLTSVRACASVCSRVRDRVRVCASIYKCAEERSIKCDYAEALSSVGECAKVYASVPEG